MKTNKVIASALAFIMATTVAAGSVFAAGENVTISATTAEAKAGETFSVDVMLSEVPATGIMGCEFALSYDASALTITGVTAGAIANTGSDSAESDISGECPSFYSDFATAGTITLTWSTGLSDSSYWITNDGVFATISGTVNAGTADGTYPISITAISRDDISGTNSSIYVGYIDADNKSVEYTANTTDGAVVVISEVVTTTTTETEPVVTTTTTTETEPVVTTTTTTETEPVVTTTTTTETKPVVSTTEPIGTTTATETSGGGDVVATLIGDVNLDGAVGLLDVVYLNKKLAGSVT
ncbi:MAG: hypothetical protein IJY74_04635, partial [Oscillospiraceae bacterium]|nr:hypothetical protein [Oscillospiraceae bacterium]